MRKNLLFIAALCATVAVKAETITLEPGEKKIEAAIASAEAGDVIELTGDAQNEYTEWNTITLDKAITLKAAEGATPVVHMPKIKTNAEFTAEGIEFYGFTDYLFRTEVGGDFSLTFRNCEIHDNPAYFIYISSGQSINALTIDGCIFHDNTKNENAVVNGSGTIGTFTFTNNTVYNIPGQYAVRVKGLTSAVVDHCTFYNCGKTPLAFGETAATNISVSNTTFSNPALVDGDAMIFYNYGAVDNCVYFNTSGCANWMATQTNTINADPLFADPANGDFNFSIFSPLCFAATDGRHIGDPRWEAQSGAGIDLPTDATPVVLDKGNVGAVSADMTYYGEDEEYFDFGPNDSPEDTLRWVKWLVNVNKCAYSVSTELTSENGYKLVLDIIDPSTGAVVLTSDTAKTPLFNTIDFSGLEEKSYILRLKNRQDWSEVKVKSVTFTYAGGAEVNLPGTLPNEDAILGGNAKVKVDEEGYICFSGDDNVPNCFAKWNANFTKKGEFGVSINVATTNGHKYKVQVLKGEAVVGEAEEPSQVETQGEIILKGNIKLQEAGTYTIKLINQTAHSNARVKDITFTYSGGAVVNIPGTLKPADAMLSENAFIDNDTIIFAPRGSEGHTPEGWAKWNVHLENDAICAFTAKCYVFNDNGSTFQIKVFNAENEVVYQKSKEIRKMEDIEVEINLESTLLPAGDYVIQMQNTVKHSKGRLMSVVVEGSPILVITDNSDIDFSAYTGRTVNVQLIRTFKANMYNPLCLPFAVSDELFQQIFKSTKSFTLSEASLENQKLFVKLAENYGIYQGTPVMVKPSEDVVYPIFENVEIKTANPSSTTKGPLCLRGSFARHELENKENVLLVGANNTLFFPSDDAPHIKSMRAYFELQNVEPSQMPRFAAFVEPGNAPTEMIIVGGEAERQKGHRKVLVDGQIRIQHEGKCYSILGLER